MRTTGNITTKDGIHWYYEQEGSGPDLVLIPDGFGECKMFDKPMSTIAAAGFRVTTFDTPGMSRSIDAPPETYQDATAQKLAAYILTLLDELKIGVATFWGCSSGGSTVLALVADHPDRVRSAMAHEVPTTIMDQLAGLAAVSDDVIAAQLAEMSRSFRCGNVEAWDGLGDEAHARLRKNYPRWARGYPLTIPLSSPVKDLGPLKNRPIDWSVGATTPTADFIDNVITAVKLGITPETLPGSHFPYVSHPDAFAEYVTRKAKVHLDAKA